MSLWVPKLRAEYIIEGALYQEALDYARRSRAYTSDRHDFHSGGLDNKQQKMLEGKLGEKAFKLFLQDNGIRFEEDHSSYEERDEYDFLLQGSGLRLRVDVKTRTEEFHIRTLELVEQTISHPKELYVSARLYRERNAVRDVYKRQIHGSEQRNRCLRSADLSAGFHAKTGPHCHEAGGPGGSSSDLYHYFRTHPAVL